MLEFENILKSTRVLACLAGVALMLSPLAHAGNPAPINAKAAAPKPSYTMPANFPYQEIDVTTPDLVDLHGRLYDPSQMTAKPSATGEPGADANSTAPTVPPDAASVTKYPLVILLHGLNGTKEDWGALPAMLVKKGYAVLALDQRGHGESTRDEHDRYVSWRLMTTLRQWKEFPLDVQRVIRDFSDEGDYPQVDTHRVAIIGAHIGGNIGVLAAAQSPETIKALVLLSPGVEYKGLDISKAIVEYSNPLFVAASQDDTYAFDSAKLLYHWAVGAKKMQLYRDIGNGTDMLKHLPSLSTDIIDWLDRYFPPTPLYPPGKEPPKTPEEPSKKPARTPAHAKKR